jgi:diguanylate cyclase (GGDEF)-like protein
MPEWLTIIGQSLLVFMLSFAALVALSSHLRYQMLAARSADVRQHGPAATTAFELRISQWLGTAHRTPPPFTVIRITLANWPLLRDVHGADAMNEAMERLRERLRSALRASDVAMRLQEDELGALAQAGRASAPSLLPRLLNVLSDTPVALSNGTAVRVDALAGVAFYPEDGARAAELCAKAEQALAGARADGRGWRGAESAAAAQPASVAAHTGGEEDTGSLLDPLTGVLASDRMGSALQKYVAARRREDLPVSILALDVDLLSRYNRQYGRDMGDQLLREVAAFLQRNTRESDLIARWHEDQFVIALDCPPDVAHAAVAQRLWAGLRRASFGGAGLRISVTIGTAGWPGHSGHARGLFEEAQIALRVGKSRGRNQCVLFDPDMRKMNVAAAPVEVF